MTRIELVLHQADGSRVMVDYPVADPADAVAVLAQGLHDAAIKVIAAQPNVVLSVDAAAEVAADLAAAPAP